MSKTTKENTRKEPKSIEWKVLFPYLIIFTLLTVGVGFAIGWMSHIEYMGEVKSEARTIVSDLKG